MNAENPRLSLLVLGRLHGVTRKGLRRAVEQLGGVLCTYPNSRVDLVAIAHNSASAVLCGAPPLTLPEELDASKLVSELTLKRMLGLAKTISADHRTLEPEDVLRASQLAPNLLECLVLFDVLEPDHAKFSYGDLLIAREVKRLLDRGYDLGTIVQAALALRRSCTSLARTKLVEAPWGEMLQQVCGGLASLDGQLTLSLPHETCSSDELFERAEICEATGDLRSAERLYRRAMATDRTDPAIPYNLANVLDAQGRRAEAVLAYYQALQLDPHFAEAWFNLGVIAEGEGRTSDAVGHYRAAISTQPAFADAVFNLALLLTEQEVYREAGALWERFVCLRPHGPDATRAKRWGTLCRVGQRAAAEEPLPVKAKMAPPRKALPKQALLC